MNNTLAANCGVSNDTIHTILHEDLITSKKSARWVLKILSLKTAIVGNWFSAIAIRCLENTPYRPEQVLADFFLLSHVKKFLAGFTETAESLKTVRVGVTATIAKEASATAFRKC